MSKSIYLNCNFRETRVGVVEEGELTEFFVERPVNNRVAGNVYKGKVENVLPGMEAAFVDVGLERNAFLYIADALAHHDEDMDLSDVKHPAITDILKEGQEIIVQVTKEPMGTKGARVATQITLPARYLVLMPYIDYVGVSRRILDEQERERLRTLAEKVRPQEGGLIVRTVAQGKEHPDLERDAKFLANLWRNIKKRAGTGPAPLLLHREADLTYRTVRDLLTEEVDQLAIDSSMEYQKALDLVKTISPELKGRLHQYTRKQPLFDYYGLEREIETALKRRVWLKSGGYIVIDQVEALTVIDVNTGKFVGSTNLEDTVLKTNLEAVKEIARQLRLRDIGGIVIIDFIDMEKEGHRRKVLKALEDDLKKDRTKATILGLTQLGLVELTRKKVRQGLDDMLFKSCTYCEGKGKILSEETMGSKVEREIKKIARQTRGEAIFLELHPSVAAVVIGSAGVNLKRLEQETGRYIYVKGSHEVHVEEIRILFVGPRRDVERLAMPVSEGQVMDLKIEEPLVSHLQDGIGRVDGYVIDVENAGHLIGEQVKVEITKVFRTYAKARLVQSGN